MQRAVNRVPTPPSATPAPSSNGSPSSTAEPGDTAPSDEADNPSRPLPRTSADPTSVAASCA